MKTFISLSDTHYPYEDKDAMTMVRAFMEDLQPDIVVLNGDILDCPTISKYAPRRGELLKETSLQDQLDYATDRLEELRETVPGARFEFIEGNHEDRLQLYLGSKAKELASLRVLDFDQLAKLDDLGMNHTVYGQGVWLNDRLFCYHGQYIGSNWTDKERMSSGASTITGHQHQQRVSYHRDRSRSYKNVGQGCLCSMNPPYLRTPPNWQQGFVYGYIFDNDKFRTIEVEIVRGEHQLWMAPEGEMYTATLASTSRRRKATRTSPRAA